ncbi:hypothetical protein GCM10029992_23660 [Glycomyces albus]
MPPMPKNANEVTKYSRPICLASVVRRVRASQEPFGSRRTGQGRATIGVGSTLGSTVVTLGLQILIPGSEGRIIPRTAAAAEGKREAAWRCVAEGVLCVVVAARVLAPMALTGSRPDRTRYARRLR